MKIFTVLGTGWLGLELAKKLKSSYKIKVSIRDEEKLKLYENEGFSSYVLNENNYSFLDELLDTSYLFVNFPPSKSNDYLGFLNKIYNHEKIKNIKKIIFISSTSVYPSSEGFYNEDFEIKDPSSKIVYEAEKLVESKTDVIFRASGLVGANRIPGRRLSAKYIECPKTKMNFVHRNDVINASKYVIENNISGIFNLCSKQHPTKEELYSFNSIKYGFELPIFSDNTEHTNRLIDGSKISKLGFEYKYTDAFNFE